jgi:hypothetical protein
MQEVLSLLSDDATASWIASCTPLEGVLPRPSAMPVQLTRVSEQAQENTSPSKNSCDKQVSS